MYSPGSWAHGWCAWSHHASWEGQPTAAPFLLFHDFPGSVCADESGLLAPSHWLAWLWGRGRPRDHAVCASDTQGSCPLLAQHPVSEARVLACFLLGFFSIFPSYFLSIHPGGRRFCLTAVSDILLEYPQAGTTLGPIRTYLTWGTLGTSMRRSTLVLSEPERPKSRSEKQEHQDQEGRRPPGRFRVCQRPSGRDTHSVASKVLLGCPLALEAQAGGLNDDASGTWNTPGT